MNTYKRLNSLSEKEALVVIEERISANWVNGEDARYLIEQMTAKDLQLRKLQAHRAELAILTGLTVYQMYKDFDEPEVHALRESLKKIARLL